jgi:hypothetical protein
MTSRTRTRMSLALGVTALYALSMSASASALTLGSVGPPGLGGCTSCDVFQYQVAAGEPKYRVPAGSTGFWTITSWSTQGGGTDVGHARIRVYRQTGTAGQFKLIRESPLRTIPANGHPTFATSLDVKKGDLLGLGTLDDVSSGYPSGVAGDTAKTIFCDPTGPGELVGQGTSCPLGNLSSTLVNVSATLKPR